MAGVAALAGGDADGAAIGTDGEGPAEVLLPPAEADHLVVGGPVGEGVVAGMPDIDAAAVAHERLEVLLHRARPGRAAAEVVAGLDDDVVVGELRPPRVPTRRVRRLWRGRDVHLEHPGRLEDAADERRGEPPVVVAVAVHDQHADGRLDGEGARGRRRQQHAQDQAKRKPGRHGSGAHSTTPPTQGMPETLRTLVRRAFGLRLCARGRTGRRLRGRRHEWRRSRVCAGG